MKALVVAVVLALATGAAAQTNLGIVSIDGITNSINDYQLVAGTNHRGGYPVRFYGALRPDSVGPARILLSCTRLTVLTGSICTHTTGRQLSPCLAP